MKSLERAYALIQSGLTVITEDNNDNGGLQTVPDNVAIQSGLVPQTLAKYYVKGSGKKGGTSESWSAEFKLQIPTSEVTDGTEDRESAFDYLEKRIRAELPQDTGNPGGAYVNSYALAVDEESNDKFTTVRCLSRGGLDI